VFFHDISQFILFLPFLRKYKNEKKKLYEKIDEKINHF
jgi:hypothetical protein